MGETTGSAVTACFVQTVQPAVMAPLKISLHKISVEAVQAATVIFNEKTGCDLASEDMTAT